MQKVENSLHDKLVAMKQQGVLHDSLSPMKTNQFEILEFYGDAVLYERISFFLMQTKRFTSPGLLTVMRQSTICNANLAAVYEKLQISNLIEGKTSPTAVKDKADIVESVIGELSEGVTKKPHLADKISSILYEVLCYVFYLGEQSYFAVQQNSSTISTNKSSSLSSLREKSPPKQIISQPQTAAEEKIKPDRISPPKKVSFSPELESVVLIEKTASIPTPTAPVHKQPPKKTTVSSPKQVPPSSPKEIPTKPVNIPSRILKRGQVEENISKSEPVTIPMNISWEDLLSWADYQ